MNQQGGRKNHFLAVVLALAGALHFNSQSALAQRVEPVPTQAAAPLAPAAGPAAAPAAQKDASQLQESDNAQSLHLLVGRSLVVTSPTRIKRVSLADPAIAEAIVVSPTQVLVNGKTPGGVSLLLWDEVNQSQAFEVSVDIDVMGLSQKIHEVFSSAAVADKILEVVKNSTPKVTSLMEVPVAPTGEILLQVKFADVNRQAVSALGINILSLPGSKNIGTISTQQFAPPQLTSGSTGAGTKIGLSDLLNIFIFRPDINFAATIKALQANNVLQILAEPNLITSSGKEASFLAGGEFPFPVLQSTGGGGGSAAITIQFKEFGVRLKFTPTLTADGLVHLKVAPEVSSLDFANALTIQGFTIPAIATNRVESEMDLKDGQSFAIAGLLDNRVTEQLSKIPGIGDIPILGKLFQSRSLTKSKNELLIVVTPVIVHPLDQAPQGPRMPKPFLEPLPAQQAQPPASK